MWPEASKAAKYAWYSSMSRKQLHGGAPNSAITAEISFHPHPAKA
jgi:hypothetical protein